MDRLSLIKQIYYNVKADDNSHLKYLSDEELIKKILDSESRTVKVKDEKLKELNFTD